MSEEVQRPDAAPKLAFRDSGSLMRDETQRERPPVPAMPPPPPAVVKEAPKPDTSSAKPPAQEAPAKEKSKSDVSPTVPRPVESPTKEKSTPGGSSSTSPTPESPAKEKQMPKPDASPAAPRSQESPVPEKPKSDAGQAIPVRAFRLNGLTALPETEAQALLAEHVGQPTSLEGLHRIAEKLEQWLKARGLFLARAYVPPQEIKDGVIEVRVMEGKLEGIDIKRAPGTRIDEDTLRLTLATSLSAGMALEQERLERGLLLLNDLPATSARAVLVPGKAPGTTRVVVEAAQGEVYTGSVELDNGGNRYTGAARLTATLFINDLSGRGDLGTIRAVASEGSSFARVGWSLPLGNAGWRAGAALIDSRFTLCCDPAAETLQSSGQARAVSAYVSYPLVRTRLSNLSLSANMAQRHFVDRSLGANISDKQSDTLTLALNGDRSALSGQGAYSTYGLQWVTGRMDLADLAADLAQDALTARTHGGFLKWTAQASHLQRLSGNSALYGALSGQWSDRNLDSSEKFVLGGLQGVRAYPSGEATGDEGWLATVEWRRELDRDWRLALFADHGVVSLHKSPWTNWNAATPGLSNHYALSGIGASLAWSATPRSQIVATLASKIGSNPARDTQGRDSDNRSDNLRLWLQGNVMF
ncbi:ShlB/FhaC/HecB family hemolysin secretion/activation protein [Denitratisoma oestradiolicum]|uniref:Putative ShlB/FhaC/HecB family hemolysin secretion/activation protein n=1 Tax=Denitratisoma oestradiolicum TaxID=311182 RepID=A0A6S6YI02_9PROT|nr:ShlB/FhaC/HecB family hemolysin secretion/activation protein [Denitratisoma oestradiolicum]CAB1367354.1 putative ShlB/FhaC/HecB family hemolysin secretion/activation protein [Denitratisoma oestradiolicum]